MNPVERFRAAARFEPVDHVPVAGAITDFYLEELTPGLDGLPEPDRHVKMLERSAALFPEIPVIFMLNPTPALYPSLFEGIRQAASGGPVLVEHLRNARIPDPESDAMNQQRLAEIMRWNELLPNNLKQEYGYLDGVLRFENPFDMMVELVGSTAWFEKVACDPEFVIAAMELLTEASIAGAKWLASRIGSPKFVMLAEDFPGYINAAGFERFVLPFHRMILQTFPDALKLLHNDSNTTHLLGLLPRCGMDVFHFGYEVDVAAAKAAMGGKVALMGNLAPMTVLARATLGEVEAHCEAILRAGAPGGGFIFATGGEVNPGTEPSRVNLMVEYAKRLGSY